MNPRGYCLVLLFATSDSLQIEYPAVLGRGADPPTLSQGSPGVLMRAHPPLGKLRELLRSTPDRSFQTALQATVATGGARTGQESALRRARQRGLCGGPFKIRCKPPSPCNNSKLGQSAPVATQRVNNGHHKPPAPLGTGQYRAPTEVATSPKHTTQKRRPPSPSAPPASPCPKPASASRRQPTPEEASRKPRGSLEECCTAPRTVLLVVR